MQILSQMELLHKLAVTQSTLIRSQLCKPDFGKFMQYYSIKMDLIYAYSSFWNIYIFSSYVWMFRNMIISLLKVI